MSRTSTPSLIDARRRAGRAWDALRGDVAAETGLEFRRGGWTLLAVAFCAGLALAARSRSRPADEAEIRRPEVS